MNAHVDIQIALLTGLKVTQAALMRLILSMDQKMLPHSTFGKESGTKRTFRFGNH